MDLKLKGNENYKITKNIIKKNPPGVFPPE